MFQGTEEVQEEDDDGYTPPQEDYLPPGLQVMEFKHFWGLKRNNYFLFIGGG